VNDALDGFERDAFLGYSAAALGVVAALAGMIGVATLTVAWLAASSSVVRVLAAAPLLAGAVAAAIAATMRARRVRAERDGLRDRGR
jgi:hypothetical protein